jgi:transcriptional regulator with XRE-family HTH domain
MKGLQQKDVADIVGVSAPTVSEWLSAKKFPRIDKIEILSNYFGILKSDLIEEKPAEHKEMQKKNDALADIVVRMRTDEDFFEAINIMYNLDNEKFLSIKQMLTILK